MLALLVNEMIISSLSITFHSFSSYLLSALLFLQIKSLSGFSSSQSFAGTIEMSMKLSAPSLISPSRCNFSSKRCTSRDDVDILNKDRKEPNTGDIVTVSYSLIPNDGFVPNRLFDVGDNITFILNKGNYLPALHSTVSTMRAGEEVDKLTFDAGWGERRQELIAKIPKESRDDLDYNQIQVDSEIILSNGLECRVIDVTDSDFSIDCNPPLAGSSYDAKVRLESIEAGPSDAKFLYVPNGSYDQSSYEVLTLALGCFWGGELEYMRMEGVVGTAVGYTQGKINDPTYDMVCSGETGHTEAIQVIFDRGLVSYKKLIKIGIARLGESKFMLNQVGEDIGSQYRHGIYYHNDEQKRVAEEVIQSFGTNCVTEIKPAQKFFIAEDYHQHYLFKGGQSTKKNAKDNIQCYG